MNRIVLPVAFLMLGLMSATTFAQSEEIKRNPTANTYRVQAPNTTPHRFGQQGDGVAWVADSRSGNPVASIMKKYKDAESTADKDEVLSELRDLLSEQYDKSLDAQEDRLAQMEEKLKKLRKQLDKRLEAKVEIVDLRIDVLIKESEGLGWPDARTQPFFESNFGQGFRGPSNLALPRVQISGNNTMSPFANSTEAVVPKLSNRQQKQSTPARRSRNRDKDNSQ